MAHIIGTTRVSDDPRTGVVDSDCKVHGLEGLYIAGSSVFPTSGHANPTLMLVSLAIRTADDRPEEEVSSGAQLIGHSWTVPATFAGSAVNLIAFMASSYL
jgi:choline dehydrogenase-like flavoprotein